MASCKQLESQYCELKLSKATIQQLQDKVTGSEIGASHKEDPFHYAHGGPTPTWH